MAHPPDPTSSPVVPNERLDKYLASLCPDLSRSAVQQLISEGRVRVNGRISKPSHRLKETDRIHLDLPAESTILPASQPLSLDIVYEDDHILVVDKPAGLTTHPAPGHKTDTLANALLSYLPELADVGEPTRPGIVHRLDRDTSGLLLVAKTQHAHQDLSAQFKRRTVSKTYLALVQGPVSPPEGFIQAPVGRHHRRRKEMAVVEGGRESETRYRTIAAYGDYTLLNVTPRTGRTHQIRVHMTAIGHPVAGDATYGKRVPRLRRHFLHAASIRFCHPNSGQEMELTAPLPEDLSNFLDSLSYTESQDWR